MNNIPQISVVMSVYSEPIEWVQEAIDSILNQTFSDFEFIIINDNPNRKENKDLLDKYRLRDNRIVVIENKQNIGLTKSLNKGLKITKGKYIARMDADDISMSERFQKQYDFLEKNEDYVVCGSNVECFGKVEKVIKYNTNWLDLKVNFLIPNPTSTPIAHPTAMIRASVLNNNNIYYNEEYKVGQDYELWSRLLFLGKFYNLSTVLLRYRTSDAQISSSKKKSQLKVNRIVGARYIKKYLEAKEKNLDFANLDLLIENFQKTTDKELNSFLVSILGFYFIYYNKYSFRSLFILLGRRELKVRFKFNLLYRFLQNGICNFK